MDPEVAHEFAIGSLKVLSGMPWLCRRVSRFLRRDIPGGVRAFGLEFPNPVGLGAGMDKDGVAIPALEALGFGFIEVGTVTPRPQTGNPKPRIFRYPEQEALINRMGFNNAGAHAMAERIARSAPAGRRTCPLGINLGKAATTEIDRAVEDYLEGFGVLAPHGDYFAVNVSSPNTRGLRDLQEKERVVQLCRELRKASRARAQSLKRRPWPLLLKIAPDLTLQQVDEIVAVLLEEEFDGVIATNTTLDRPGPFADCREAGGLSGKPLRQKSNDIIAHIARTTGGKLSIVGVGGIFDLDSAQAKFDAGACLVQLYTGFVYEGPGLPRRIVAGLRRRVMSK